MSEEVSLHHRSVFAEDECPVGYLWYSCATNSFVGCCSFDPCGLGAPSCPIANQPVGEASSTRALAGTTSAITTPLGIVTFTATASLDLLPSSSATSVITTVATPRTTPVFTISSFFLSTKSAFVPIHRSSSKLLTVVKPPSPTASVGMISASTIEPSASSLPPLHPSSSSSAIVSVGTNKGTPFPTALVVGIAAGLFFLAAATLVLFCILWRTKRTRPLGCDDEAVELRASSPAPLPPSFWIQSHEPDGAESVGAPVEKLAAAGFPEVVRPFWGRYPEMPSSAESGVAAAAPSLASRRSSNSSSGVAACEGFSRMGGESSNFDCHPPSTSVFFIPTCTV